MQPRVRHCVCLVAGLCLATLAGGCTTLNMGKSPAAAGINSKEDDGLDAGPTAANSSGRTGRPEAPATRSAAPRRAGPGHAGPPERDPATVAVIDRELSDATPEEREALLKAFRTLPDASVRHMLSERRKGLRLAAPSLSPLTNEVSKKPEPAAPVVVQAAAPEAGAAAEAPGGARRSPLNGLGTISAWKNEAALPPPLSPPQGESAKGDTPVAEATSENEPAPNAVHSVAFGQVQSDGGIPVEQSPVARAGGVSRNPATAPSSAAGRPAAPAAGKPNPILGYLLPGRFGAQAAAGKPADGAASGSATTASVAVGVPREAPPGPEASATGLRAIGGSSPQDILLELIAATEPEVARLVPGESDPEKRVYIEQHVYLRMLYLMAGQQERAMRAIPGIEPADQEFWQHTFWGLTNYFDENSIPSSADRAAQTVAQLTSAVLRLQEKANLDLRNVSFCHKIASFGNYEKYPRDEFRPGQEVLLYAEVANVHSAPSSDGRFRTSLKSTIEIYRYGTDGELVEQIELPETVDVCRTHRRDYFHSYQFTIPSGLTLGPHVLKLTVEDQLSRRSTSYSLNFMVK